MSQCFNFSLEKLFSDEIFDRIRASGAALNNEKSKELKGFLMAQTGLK